MNTFDIREDATLQASRAQMERWFDLCINAGEFEQAEELRREAMSAETYSINTRLQMKRVAQMKGYR